MVGLAFYDAAARKLGAAEFADDDQFCTLEAVALQLGAKECVLVRVSPGSRAQGFPTCERPHQLPPSHLSALSAGAMVS